MVLKRVGPLSLAKISGALYAIIGLLIGALFSLVSMIGLAAMGSDGPEAFGFLFGVGAVIWAPIIYGGLGFVMALIGAALYNLLARWTGGVELQLE